MKSVSELEWIESPDEGVLQRIAGLIESPRIVQSTGIHPNDAFVIDAEMVYGQTLFSAHFVINRATGDVVIDGDTALADNLELVADASRLPYIGDFDAEDNFRPLGDTAN